MTRIKIFLFVVFSFVFVVLFVGDNVTAHSAPVGQCAPPPLGIVSWWPFDNSSRDIIGVNHGIRFYSPVSYPTGLVGDGSIMLDGFDDYIDVGNGPSLNFTGDYTIEMWVKPSVSSRSFTGDWHDLMQKGRAIKLGFDGKKGLYFQVSKAQDKKQIYKVYGNTFMEPDTWYHVAAVRKHHSILIYVNGVLKDSRSGIKSDLHTGGKSPMTIGGRDGGGVKTFYNTWDGMIDEASFYGRALSREEIVAIVAAGSFGKCK